MKIDIQLPQHLIDATTSKVGRYETLPPELADACVSHVPKYESPGADGLGNLDNYKQAACDAIGVPHTLDGYKIYHHVGDFDITSSRPALDALVHIYNTQRKPTNYVFNYDHYLDACKRVGQIQRQLDSIDKWMMGERTIVPPTSPPDIDQNFLNHYDLSKYKPNSTGYLAYLSNHAFDLVYDVLQKPLPLYLEENPDRPHGYVVGTSGSGKSELLKLLTHTYVTNPKYGSVVVIDPTSDFITQIARWKEFNRDDRLIYIRPTLARGMTPVINPFEIDGIEATDYSEEAVNVKIVIAQQLAEAIGRIVSETGSKVSPQMETILLNCILVLLDKEDSTLVDLSRFVKDDEALIDFACRQTHNEYLTEYFRVKDAGFNAKGNYQTKEAISRRLDKLLSTGHFRKLTCGKNTVNLTKALDQKKVILFDLGKGAIGPIEGPAFGRLIIGMLLGIAYRRADIANEKDRVPCSLIVDECQNYVTEAIDDILNEARKYRLFVTLAQTTAGKRMSIELKDAVLGNTNMQVAGGTTPSGAKRNAELVGVNAEDIVSLEQGEFYVRPKRSLPAVKFKTRTDLLRKQNCVTQQTWGLMVREQIEKYYRHYDGSKKVTIEEEPDISPQVW